MQLQPSKPYSLSFKPFHQRLHFITYISYGFFV